MAVPPQVLAQYSSVNAKADQTASQPFQSYNGEFVAPTNATQNAGIAGTNAAAGEAQPYFGAATDTLGSAQSNVNPINQAATGLAAGSAQAVNPSDLDAASIQKYMSPYVQDVAGSTAALLNQNNQQQQAGQLGSAITSGAFGGDRTGIAAANLEQQQNLSNASTYANILNTGYTNAQSVAQQQQGVGLAAGQANRAALGTAAQTLSGVGATQYGEGANTATTLAGLGTGAQSAGLQGSQAQIAAGTVQQQTQQAQDTAEYNQFLQQQSYPFQVDQFLASIAEGTGALSGSTTTTQQPGGFFSDERLKEDMEPIGRTFDGQPIYRYKMKGDERDRIGLSAQKVEKTHPEAVGVAGGFRYVDYGKATEEAANRGHFHEGGVVPFRRAAMAYGGGPDDSDGGLGAVLAAQRNMYGSQGAQQHRDIQAPAASHQLTVASGTPTPGASGSSHVSQAVGLGKDAYKGYKWATKPSATGVNANPGNTAGATAPSNTAAGTTTNFEAPSAGVDGSPGTTTTFDAGLQTGDASGLGAADTAAPAASEAAAPVAADAAGTGAADAGAGVAAGAVGDAAAGAAAGAAGGAAAGAAADAAGTEAAALAAEYAAAYAAAAAAAAKRGGRITRGKFADGGTPYETNGDQLDIPVDSQTNAHLQSPGALVKRPTGMQIAMKGGQPDQASSTMGSIFSNEALARGGVAGRRGYDDGGAPTDDTVDDTPEVASDSDRGAGVSGGSKDSLWDKVKKHATAENVIPILTGLAAMGTAKTRSPGVALAAGLGAGSQSYLDTRKSLADTANEQAKTRGVDVANRLATMKANAAQDYLTPRTTPTQAPAAPASPINAPQSPGAAAQALADSYKSKYAVTPWQPQEQDALKKARGAAIALNSDQPVQDAMAAREQRVQNDTYANQKAAQVEADQLYAAATRDPDPVARKAAEAKYNAIFQWTGDKWDDQQGNRVNSRTGAPAIGLAKQTLPPSADRFTDSFGNQFIRDQQSGRMVPVGAGAPAGGAATTSTPAVATSGATPPVKFQQPVADQAHILQDIEGTRANTDVVAPTNRNINQHLLQLSGETATGPGTQTIQKLAAVAGLPSGAKYQEIDAYLNRQAAMSATAMGVPHTNAGLAASQTATGTTEYTPAALQEKVKFADALNTGAIAYRQALDKSVGTGSTPNLANYQKFRSAWAKNFDPDIFRAEDAMRRNDTAELASLKERLGAKGMKALAQKSANLRLLENGQIPP